MHLARVAVGCWLASLMLSSAAMASEVRSFRMDDGTSIAVECAGAGDHTLLIVHGGTGDRTRWTPLFPFLSARMRVCAMDRRGHGQSGDGPHYSLAREERDVAAIAAALPGSVVVLGHSYGGVAALGAAIRTKAIKKLILYEPPLQDGDHSAAAAEIESLLRSGNKDAAAETFLIKIVRISPAEVRAMKSRPSWAGLVSSMGTVLRQDRALARYRWDANRYRRLRIPALLLVGGRTRSAQLRVAASDLQAALPNATTVILPDQEHNAMDTGRAGLASVISQFVAKPAIAR